MNSKMLKKGERHLGHHRIRCRDCREVKHVSAFGFGGDHIGRDNICRACDPDEEDDL